MSSLAAFTVTYRRDPNNPMPAARPDRRQSLVSPTARSGPVGGLEAHRSGRKVVA
jgi:hypothetical protein